MGSCIGGFTAQAVDAAEGPAQDGGLVFAPGADGGGAAVEVNGTAGVFGGHLGFHDRSMRLCVRQRKTIRRRGEMLLTIASAQWQTKDMERTNAEGFERAVKHLEIVQGLLDGSIGREDFWSKGMTVAEAVAVEKRNVAYCLGQIS